MQSGVRKDAAPVAQKWLNKFARLRHRLVREERTVRTSKNDVKSACEKERSSFRKHLHDCESFPVGDGANPLIPGIKARTRDAGNGSGIAYYSNEPCAFVRPPPTACGRVCSENRTD